MALFALPGVGAVRFFARSRVRDCARVALRSLIFFAALTRLRCFLRNGRVKAQRMGSFVSRALALTSYEGHARVECGGSETDGRAGRRTDAGWQGYSGQVGAVESQDVKYFGNAPTAQDVKNYEYGGSIG